MARSSKADQDKAKEIEDAVEVGVPSEPDPTESFADSPTASPAETVDTLPEPEARSAVDPGVEAPAAPVVVQRRGGFIPTFLGGIVAAGVGAGAALYLFPDGLNLGGGSSADVALVGSVKTQGDTIEALKNDVSSLRADLSAAVEAAKAQPDSAAAVNEAQSQIAALSGSVGDLKKQLEDLSARIDATASSTATSSGGAAADGASDTGALAPQLAEMRQLIEQQKAQAAATEQRLGKVAEDAERRLKEAEDEATRLRTEAETAARNASTNAALSHLQAAMEGGAPIRPALEDLTKAGVTVPQALLDQQDGVPTLDALKAAFPDAARAALTLSLRETAGNSSLDRLWAFLRAESGARSLSPRAGDDPDAILSRAEAATKAGDLTTAIKEIGTLPPAGSARMAEWVALAERRLTAEAAVKQLAETLN